MSNIQIKNVTKVFGNYNDQVKSLLQDDKTKEEILKETGSTVAVKNANFTIEDGEIFVVMGLSGSGKSTLIRFFNDTATTEIYTSLFVGSVRCV